MTAHRTFVRRALAAATAGTAALVLAACGSDKPAGGHDMGAKESGSRPAASTQADGHSNADSRNSADVSFATEMIQHHRQAVEMAELAEGRAASKDVKSLAAKIKGAQDPEIEEMSGWLTAWGEEVPADMSGMGHDMSSSMPGMMSAGDMDELKKASGDDFDKKFLAMMVKHHEGAVAMGRTEKSDGKYGPATRLAADVVTAQTAEIEQMNKMLGKS
ncbi:DUF305 domain-containing protein [Streptomyces sp. NPDC005480]|jgi:uncharacterized protein (DUF305 family)|uniref:DUF305 domain-containing protein n=1 Tax=Streptomyces sp. NPDC005480 TaxID=3154880 RepID=UPI0033A57D9F